MPGISHEGKKGRCCCCCRCDPPDGRKNGKGGGPAPAEGDSGRRAWRDAASHCFQSKVLFSQRGRKGWEEGKAAGNIILLPLPPSPCHYPLCPALTAIPAPCVPPS